MNIKIKLTIAGQDLEVTMEEAQELKSVLDKLLPTLNPLDRYRPLPIPLQQYPQPTPYYRTPTPSPIPRVTCAGANYPPLPENIRPLDSDFPPNTWRSGL